MKKWESVWIEYDYKKKRGHATSFPCIINVFAAYFAMCSYWRVSVGWSHTSAGPKYCIGPGYT